MSLHIISGGQTGADIAGLWIGKLFNFPTGGYAPHGFITLSGKHPEMAKTFGMIEHPRSYRGRTIANLKESDLTIICSEKMSAGTKLTLEQCKKEGVPYIFFVLDPSNINASIDVQALDDLVTTIKSLLTYGLWKEELLTINIAGNSTQNSARSFEFTFKLLHRLFTKLGYKTESSEVDWVMYQDKWE